MKSLKIELNEHVYEYSIPGEWNDLTKDQLIYLVRLLDNKVTTEEVKIKMLLYSLNAYTRNCTKDKNGRYMFLIKIGRDQLSLYSEELAAISQSFDFLYSEVDGKYNINPLLTINPFPKPKCGCITVVGPEPGLTNLSYKEFSDLQIWSTRITESDLMLNKFLSIMFRRISGDPVSPELIAKMSPSVKTIMVWFYLGCLQFIQQKFPKPFEGGDSSHDVVDGQYRIIDALAQNDVTKKKDVENANLYHALYTMECAAEEHEKRLREKKHL